MARKAPIVKVLLWHNPGPLGRLEAARWDMEILRLDGNRERVVDVSRPAVRRILELVAAAAGTRRVA